MNNQLEWEDIFEKSNYGTSFATARAKVIGGWMISHSIKLRNNLATAMCFIPDEKYEWVIKNECDHLFEPLDGSYNQVDQTYKSICVKCEFVPE